MEPMHCQSCGCTFDAQIHNGECPICFPVFKPDEPPRTILQQLLDNHSKAYEHLREGKSDLFFFESGIAFALSAIAREDEINDQQ